MLLLRGARSACSFSRLSRPEIQRTMPVTCSVLLQNDSKNNSTFTIQRRNISYQGYIETIKDMTNYLNDSQMTQFFCEQLVMVHESTGLPWWSVIVGSSLVLRLGLQFPAQIYSQIVISRRKKAYIELEEKYIPALKVVVGSERSRRNLSHDEAKKIFIRKQVDLISQTIVKYNCGRPKIYLPLYMQMPIWLSMTFAVRRLMYSVEFHDQFMVQGPMFLSNMLDSTPIVMPLFIGFMFWSSMQVNLLLYGTTVPQNYAGKFMYVFANSMILFMMYLTSQVECGLALYWGASAVLGLGTNLLMISPKFKQACRIPEFPEDPKQPYQTIYKNALGRFNILDKLKRK